MSNFRRILADRIVSSALHIWTFFEKSCKLLSFENRTLWSPCYGMHRPYMKALDTLMHCQDNGRYFDGLCWFSRHLSTVMCCKGSNNRCLFENAKRFDCIVKLGKNVLQHFACLIR